ncbi:hypothetical protein MTR67_050568 [Solanum verrucosum]|uniref:Uncharacterized protein n=1 Tax=Solanum verrucosum TaxID=315347 RepID=A0AAF1A1C8_SOLVR|nr:hypothetical protein MTR67_050568 [Solanum verrucosum]
MVSNGNQHDGGGNQHNSGGVRHSGGGVQYISAIDEKNDESKPSTSLHKLTVSSLVKHKFTDYSVNAVVLMMLGSIILGLHMNGDRPINESNQQYTLGFVMTLVGVALHGFINAGVEYSHVKAGVVVTFDLVMQMQFLISMFSA